MNNIYNNPDYAQIKDDMHKKLEEMREKYGDSDELDRSNLDRYLKSKGIK